MVQEPNLPERLPANVPESKAVLHVQVLEASERQDRASSDISVGPDTLA